MIAEEWLTLMELAGAPILDGSGVAPWYKTLDPTFRRVALDRVTDLWLRSRESSHEHYLWTWACALEYAWRKQHEQAK